MKTNIVEKPGFLQVELEINKKSLIIIGTRIRDDTYENKYNQFQALDHIRVIPKDVAVIVLGDYNHGAIKDEQNESFIIIR